MIFLFQYQSPLLVKSLFFFFFFFQVFQCRNFMNPRTCGSRISFVGEISCFFNNNCNFLLKIWLRAFAFLPVSSWLHLGVPNLTVLLQDWTHQSFICCFFNILMTFRTCWSIISFEGEIGMEANDDSRYLNTRKRPYLDKKSILFYSLSDARLLWQQSW